MQHQISTCNAQTKSLQRKRGARSRRDGGEHNVLRPCYTNVQAHGLPGNKHMEYMRCTYDNVARKRQENAACVATHDVRDMTNLPIMLPMLKFTTAATQPMAMRADNTYSVTRPALRRCSRTASGMQNVNSSTITGQPGLQQRTPRRRDATMLPACGRNLQWHAALDNKHRADDLCNRRRATPPAGDPSAAATHRRRKITQAIYLLHASEE